ncbi:hypothetical protein BGW41_007314 [Actinomortierella wolfii]|nr:hypothetical protein BGW41_007314 [Actinomortierella wolfii]
MGAEQNDMIDFDAPEDDLMSGKLPPPLVSSSGKEPEDKDATTKNTSLLDIEADHEPVSMTEATVTTTDEVKAKEDEGDQEFGEFGTSSTTAIEQDFGEADGTDEFGDFGTATATTTTDAQDPFAATDFNDGGNFGDASNFGGATTQTNAIAADDDEFGDFGGAPTASGDGQDDFDDFGDFGEVQQVGGDDEFGDFGDFADGTGGGDDFGDFEQGTSATTSAAFGDVTPVKPTQTDSQPVDAPVPLTEPEVEIAPDFNAVNSRQVENYVLAQLEKIFPLEDGNAETNEQQQKQKDMLAPYDTENGLVLAEQELWKMLCEQSMQGIQGKSPSTAPQFQWKYSHLRKEYYASLGLATINEQTAVPASSIPGYVASSGSASSTPKSRTASPLIIAPERMPQRRTLDIAAARAYCNFTRESLGGYSGEEMKEIIARLTDLTKQASEELTYWLDQREQMAMDSERYNGMIASLVGRAAKLKESESKQASKTKRLTRSSFGLMSSS